MVKLFFTLKSKKKKNSELCFVFLFQVVSNVLFLKVMFSFSFSSANKTRQLVALGRREKTNYVCKKKKKTSLFFFCLFYWDKILVIRLLSVPKVHRKLPFGLWRVMCESCKVIISKQKWSYWLYIKTPIIIIIVWKMTSPKTVK